jgi:hypothetical protein
VAVPASQETLCCYVAFLARSLSPSSISGYLNIIRILHLDAGLTNPLADNWQVQLVKRGVTRLKGQPVKQKLPITVEMLREFFPFLDHFGSAFDKSFWAAALIAFFGFFRKSTILPVSAVTPGGILRSDILSLSRTSFELAIRHTKTIQFGQRVLLLPFHSCLDQRLCPVRALLSHLASSPAPSDVHIFSFLSMGRPVRLTHSTFVAKLKTLLKLTKRDPKQFSAHSFRRGGSTFAFSLNMPLLHVKMRGDWKSNCVEQYIVISDDIANDAARLLAVGAANAV